MIELVLSMSLWGTLGAFAIWSGLSALEISFYRCFIGAIFAGILLLKAKQKLLFNREELIVGLAGVLLTLNWLFLFKSFQLASITIGNMSYYLQPIILMILGVIFFKEKVSTRQWAFISLALAGVLLTIEIQSFQRQNNVALGCGYAILAALLYSFVTVLMKRIKMPFQKVLFIQFSVGALMLLPFIWNQLAPNNTLKLIGPRALSNILAIGILHTFVAYILYYRAIQKTSFATIAIISYLDPLIAIASDVIFFEKPLSSLQIFGVGLSFIAIFNLSSKKSQFDSLEFNAGEQSPST